MPRNRKQNYKPKNKVRTKDVLEGDAIQKPIERTIDEELPLIFSDGLIVRHLDEVFYLSFLQLQYPLATTPEEFKEISSIEHRCVSQVVVTAIQMARNINVLNTNFKKFVEKQSDDVKELLNKIAGYSEESDNIESEVKLNVKNDNDTRK